MVKSATFGKPGKSVNLNHTNIYIFLKRVLTLIAMFKDRAASVAQAKT